MELSNDYSRVGGVFNISSFVIFQSGGVFTLNSALSAHFIDSLSNRFTRQKNMGQQEGFNEVLIQPLQQFAKDSIHLVKKCTKPDRKEFMQIAKATGVGFLIMGFIGFFVKLVHIPINNILVGN